LSLAVYGYYILQLNRSQKVTSEQCGAGWSLICMVCLWYDKHWWLYELSL